MTTRRVSFALCAIVSLLLTFPAGDATITIVNKDPVGVGFNDPTPAAPVGGNAGTTLGQQRLNVFQAAAAIWGPFSATALRHSIWTA